MIKLTLPSRPTFLTYEKVAELTAIFKADKNKRVWDIPALKSALLELSNGKCAFSEVRLNMEGKYMQIEHFYPKSKYPDKVMEWGNLLPCLNICNSRKKDIDPANNPLVHPFFDNPIDFFYIENGRLCALDCKNQKAVNTINAYDLNNQNHLRIPRFKWQIEIKKRLREIYEVFDKIPILGRNRLLALLEDCGRHADYSALKATVILEDAYYQKLRKILTLSGKWDVKFQELEEELIFCSLPKPEIL